jgi:hypothetical protein
MRIKKVRLTITDNFLKSMYGIEEGSVLLVLRTVQNKGKIKYQVRVPKFGDSPEYHIWLNDKECSLTTFKLDKYIDHGQQNRIS